MASGSDPFSNTNTRNILQHIIVPKIVSDGASGYAVKTDVINVNNIYVEDTVAAGSEVIRIGASAGAGSTGSDSIAIGYQAGQIAQGTGSIAIGRGAGLNQANGAIAIGESAGSTATLQQGYEAIAIGQGAGTSGQGDYAIALGSKINSLPIPQPTQSICINATGNGLLPLQAGTLYVAPIRDLGGLATSGFYRLYYNPITGEIAYDSVAPTP